MDLGNEKFLYADIHSLVFTLSSRPKGIYDIGLGEPYLYIKRKWEEKNIYAILQFIWHIQVLYKKDMISI